MGNKKLGLLLIIFMCLYDIAASSPIQKGLDLPSDSVKDIDLGTTDTLQHEKYAGSGVAHNGKIARGIGSGGSTGSGEHRTNGGPGTPYVQGGAESNHHPNTHHGGSSCNSKCVGLLTFIMTAVASLVHLYIGLQN